MQNAALALDLLFLPRCRQTRITDLVFPCRSISKTMNSSGALGTFPHTQRRWGVRLAPLCSGERGSGRDSGCWRRTAAAVPAPHGPLRSRSAQRGAEGGAAAGGRGGPGLHGAGAASGSRALLPLAAGCRREGRSVERRVVAGARRRAARYRRSPPALAFLLLPPAAARGPAPFRPPAGADR